MADEKKNKETDDRSVDVMDSLYFGRWINLKMFRILVFVSIALIISLSVNVYTFVFRKISPVYFASSSDGRLIPMVPLDSPVRSERWLVQWTAKTIDDLLTMTAVDYNRSFLRVRNRFLPQTLNSLVKTFDDNGTKKYIIDNKMDTYVSLEAPPVIVQTGIVSGQRAWKIQAPIVVTYTNGSGNAPKHYIVNLVVVRVPTSVNKNGVAISNFVMMAGSVKR